MLNPQNLIAQQKIVLAGDVLSSRQEQAPFSHTETALATGLGNDAAVVNRASGHKAQSHTTARQIRGIGRRTVK